MQCAIIGAGSIGGLIDSPSSPNTASHANAFFKEPRCQLVAICEPNEINQKAFIARWGKVAIYHSIEALLDYEKIALLIIASPTQFHANALEKALLNKDVQTILCEKPLVSTAEELAQLKPLLLESNKKILINLMRRFDPSLMRIQSLIQAQKWGKAVCFQGVFTKGLLHNGIHMLAMLSHFFGEIKAIKPMHVESIKNDLLGDFEVIFETTQGVISVLDLPYSAFELTLWFENGKIEIREGGAKITTYAKVPSPLYEGYFSLEHEEDFPNTLKHYALHSLQFLLQTGDVECRKILEEHIKVHEKIFETIGESV